MGFGPRLQVASMSIALGSHGGLDVNLIDGVAAIAWAGAECTGLVTPVTGLRLAPTPVMAVVQLECRVCNVIFITEDHSIVPILGDIIRRLTIGETGNVVLYDEAQPMLEFQHNICAFSVLCMIH